MKRLWIFLLFLWQCRTKLPPIEIHVHRSVVLPSSPQQQSTNFKRAKYYPIPALTTKMPIETMEEELPQGASPNTPLYKAYQASQLTFSTWDDAYERIMKEFEISPEDSEKLKAFKQMRARLDEAMRERGMSEKQIRRFYVLNYLQAQASD